MRKIHIRLYLTMLVLLLVQIGFISPAFAKKWREIAAPSIEPKEFSLERSKRFRATEPVAYWWRQLDDPKLVSLIDDAMNHNFDVKIALANLNKSRALLNETSADRLPTIESNVSYERQRLTEEGLSGKPADTSVDHYDAGFDAFWEIDLFGRVSQRIEREKAIVQESVAELKSVYVVITAEVARTYIELRGAQYRLDIARRNEANQSKTYELIQEMAKGGKSNDLDIARSLTLLEQTRSTIPPLEAEVSVAIHRLGVLTGRLHGALNEELKEVKPLPSIPVSISIGDPQGLIRRRPDIRQAEQQLAQAIASYNLKTADLYPEISIVGAIGFIASSFSNWGTAGAVDASIGPSLKWRILDRKRVRAEIDQADAQAQAQLVSFEKTILEALEEIENALINFTKEESRRQNLIQAAASSAKAANLAKIRFEEGLDSFIDVLDAERTQLEAEDALALGETQTALNLIAIYKALGGGWQLDVE